MNRETLPGASNALTFGILSIILTLVCCGPFGAIFSFIGLSNAKNAERMYNAEPERYSGYENVKTGRVFVLYWFGLGSNIVGVHHYLLWRHCSNHCRSGIRRRFSIN